MSRTEEGGVRRMVGSRRELDEDGQEREGRRRRGLGVVMG
jgi:hypothetical protein